MMDSIRAIIEDYLDGIVNGEILTKKGRKFRPNSVKAYKSLLDIAPELPVSEIAKWDLKGYKPNSVASIYALVGAAARHFGYNPKMPMVHKVENPVVVLADSFITEFMSARIENPVWEVAAIMLSTSLRISDAVSLLPANFQDGFLVKPNKKTGALTQMPVPKLVSTFVDQNIKSYGRVFCKKVSERSVNKVFKSFMKQYDYMNTIYSSIQYDENGEPFAVQKPLYEWITPHSLRKSAITSMLANGVSVEHVKFCSGHSEKSSSFNRYVGFVETRYKSELNNYQKQIYG